MPVSFTNFPLKAIVDGVLSYTKYLFTNEEITPPSYRYSENDRESRLRIQGPFVIDNEKPMSVPFIVVERGSFSFSNSTIDNLKEATANTFENKQKVDWMDGYVNVIVGSKAAGEASNIANFLAICYQADRHGIASQLKFVRNFNYVDVGPEIPVFKDAEVKRWEVTLRIQVSMQMGWATTIREPEPWNKVSIYAVNSDWGSSSNTGIVAEGLDTLTDANANFGFLDTSDPRLIEKELQEGYYYINFVGNPQHYPIAEIVDPNTIKLLTHDEDGNQIPYSAPESAVDLEYELYWNCVHIRGDIPNNNT
ncbi:MAG: hypothetical protein DRN81_01125 [Thermoproteota archaeon]|nr:MAG: hypothetical protein DRN81_01125 [Candidatus Korarchaeota archaeon]